MQPRTKLQHHVFRLSKGLYPISSAQKSWAFKNCLKHIGYRTKKNVFCLDCGNVWDGSQKSKSIVCPACGTKLIIQDTRKKKLEQFNITFAVIDVVEDFQVLRLFELRSWHAAGSRSIQRVKEVVQHWFKPNEKLTVIARSVSYSNFGFHGNLEIRPNTANYWSSNKYDLYVDKIAPDPKLLPIFKRNGVSSKITEVNLYSFFTNILRDSQLETLAKAKQYDLLSYLNGNRSDQVRRYWKSIKICLRQQYIVKDGKTWLDYLDLLSYFKKDLHSPKYVCVKNIDQEHNKLVAKKNKILAIQNEERRMRDEAQRLADIERMKIEAQQRIDNIPVDNIAYLKRMSKFLDLTFSNKFIAVNVLQSVADFKKEGDLHVHCVFTNEYYKKEDSIILSATVEGISMETIEISIKNMKIEQARGFDNKPSKYHDQIIDLVNKNMHLVRRAMRPIRVKKVTTERMEAVA